MAQKHLLLVFVLLSLLNLVVGFSVSRGSAVTSISGEKKNNKKAELLQTSSPSSSFKSITSIPIPCPFNKNPFESILPPVLGRSGNGVDLTVTWNSNDDTPRHVAQQVLDQIIVHASAPSSIPKTTKNRMETYLTTCLTEFQSFCDEHLTRAPSSYQIRLVATRGPASTKCPQWHLDHVPLRWIQSLVGPGCEYIEGTTGINWSSINGLDDDDDDSMAVSSNVQNRNAQLVNPDIATIRQAATGEAMILTGTEISNYVSSSLSEDLLPVVHKSPNIPMFQGRVLVTQNVVEVQQEQMADAELHRQGIARHV